MTVQVANQTQQPVNMQVINAGQLGQVVPQQPVSRNILEDPNLAQVSRFDMIPHHLEIDMDDNGNAIIHDLSPWSQPLEILQQQNQRVTNWRNV